MKYRIRDVEPGSARLSITTQRGTAALYDSRRYRVAKACRRLRSDSCRDVAAQSSPRLNSCSRMPTSVSDNA